MPCKSTQYKSLLTKGSEDRAETLTPLLAFLSAGALSDPPIDHAKAQCALSDIVDRVDTGIIDKGQNIAPVGVEALGQKRHRCARDRGINSIIRPHFALVT